MKFVLFFLIATSDGVTESQSDFVTLEACEQAAAEMHIKYDDVALVVQTECKTVTFYDG